MTSYVDPETCQVIVTNQYVTQEHQDAAKSYNDAVKQRKDKIFAMLLDDPDGREFVWDLLQYTRFYNPAPPEDIERWAGAHDVGAMLHNMVLTINPDAYTLMREEAQSRFAQLSDTWETLKENL